MGLKGDCSHHHKLSMKNIAALLLAVRPESLGSGLRHSDPEPARSVCSGWSAAAVREGQEGQPRGEGPAAHRTLRMIGRRNGNRSPAGLSCSKCLILCTVGPRCLHTRAGRASLSEGYWAKCVSEAAACAIGDLGALLATAPWVCVPIAWVPEMQTSRPANQQWHLIPILDLETVEKLLWPNLVTHFIKVPVINLLLIFIKLI